MLTQSFEERVKNESTFLILVVDDDEDVRELITYILDGAEFKLIIAADGNSALTEIMRQKPDLILLDLMLSDTTGLEVLEKIRRSPDAGVREIPVILLSALVHKPDVKVYATIGTTEFLAKPFQARVLIQRVTAIMNANRHHASSIAKLSNPMKNEKVELPEVQSLVTERRDGVLLRAIEALEAASNEKLQAVSHKIAGSLLLYSFVEEGGTARTFSMWLAANPEAESAEVLRRRNNLLDLLKSLNP